MNAEQVSRALRNRFSDRRQYAVAEQVGLTTGFSRRRLDMVVVDCFSSNGFKIDGFEIKVSAADLRRELQDPDKHVAFFKDIDYFTLVCPQEVIKSLLDVIPKKWGILIVNEDGTTRYKRKPLALEDAIADRDVSRGFMASLFRAVLNQRPVDSQIQEAFENGKREERQAAGWQGIQVRDNYEKIKKYDDLSVRLRVWGKGDMEKAIAEFEAFRNLHLDRFKDVAEELKGKLDGAIALLEGKEGKQE